MNIKGRNLSIFIILILAGIILGGIIGDIFSDMVPFLSYDYEIGIKDPIHLDLSVIALTFGLVIDINVASVIGILIAYLLYKRL